MEPTQREQKLVDLCFSIALMLSDTKGRDRAGKKLTLYRWPQEKKAAWIAEQLRACGFPTHPCGASHGVLEDQSTKEMLKCPVSIDYTSVDIEHPSTKRAHEAATHSRCNSFWKHPLVLNYAMLYDIGRIVPTAALTPTATAYRYISKLIRGSTGLASNKRLAADPKVYVDRSGYMTIWYMGRTVVKLDMLDHLPLMSAYYRIIKSYAVSRATPQQLLRIRNIIPLREVLANIEKEKHETSKAV